MSPKSPRLHPAEAEPTPVAVRGRRFEQLLALGIAVLLAGSWTTSAAPPFRLPTDNRNVLQSGRDSWFFAPTPGRTWTAGQFGCVRSGGDQMHEGVDILSLRKDSRGEPIDEVRAAASGSVAYVNRRAGLSNYGIYLVLRHRVEGIEVFSLYAHLREARSDLKPGTSVRAGENVGVVGRTTNTRTSIGQYRAHLHFEIGLLVNDEFSAWLKKHEPGTRDYHGAWNGRNLLGLDPAEIFRLQEKQGAGFSLLEHLRGQREMCRVLVADTSFPWLKRYPTLIRRNSIAARDGIAAYEVSLNYNGVPFRLVPRSRNEIKGTVATRVLDVDEAEFAKHRCRKLIFKKGQTWILTARGQSLFRLLCH